jgi:hypothetical protein
MTSHIDYMETALLAVAEVIQGGTYPPGRRIQMQVAYCHLVIEHQSAIALLIQAKRTGSAFALARPIFEAMVKGLWLFHCANDAQLERCAKGKEMEKVMPLLENLMLIDLPPVITRSLQQVKSRYWKTLSSLTHIGHTQIRHWLNPQGVKPNYPAEALDELANFASFMVLVAGRELAMRASNAEGTRRLTQMLPDSPPV